ncbi:MAG TPA: redoxin domain-containing protein [Thermoanaerobaculia bacterium]|jgi:peroxiredoxin (alkyl hydroperoxide reductase subunit C)|nr:redoxin domain-containing protein [Thermoanaerobaculia bacterium]
MADLKIGDMAPDFTLPSTVGDKVTLSDYRGKKNVLLLFYPAAFSGVCSTENRQCGELTSANPSDDVEVLGISVDNLWSQRAFGEKLGVGYPLLADFHPKGDVAKKYGAYNEERGFANRTAFIVGKDGRIREIVASETPVARDIPKLLERARSA